MLWVCKRERTFTNPAYHPDNADAMPIREAWRASGVTMIVP